MEEALKAVGVSRRYGKRQVLDGFWLTMGKGSFEALMGPSGSGKSTFLHLAAGLLAVDAGSILVGGRNVAQMTDAEATRFRRRHVGVVFHVFFSCSVRKNDRASYLLVGVSAVDSQSCVNFDCLIEISSVRLCEQLHSFVDLIEICLVYELCCFLVLFSSFRQFLPPVVLTAALSLAYLPRS